MLGPAIVRINLFVRSIATISDIKMVSCYVCLKRFQNKTYEIIIIANKHETRTVTHCHLSTPNHKKIYTQTHMFIFVLLPYHSLNHDYQTPPPTTHPSQETHIFYSAICTTNISNKE